jgi:hypothetical protein
MVCIIEDIFKEGPELEYERSVGYLVYGIEVERAYACSAGINPRIDHRIILVHGEALDKLVRGTIEEVLLLPNDGRLNYGIKRFWDYSDLFCEIDEENFLVSGREVELEITKQCRLSNGVIPVEISQDQSIYLAQYRLAMVFEKVEERFERKCRKIKRSNSR